MTPEKRKELEKHIEEIANILYEEVDPTKIDNLAGIESTIREQTLEYITPKIGLLGALPLRLASTRGRIRFFYQEKDEN